MNILIVDDDQLVSLSLKTILEKDGNIHVSAVGHSGEEAIALYEEYLPDVLLMDIRMENLTGLDATKRIIGAHPEAKILLLTTFSDDEYIVKAIQFGAKGYILKQDFTSIAPALVAVHNGQSVFGNEIVGRLPHLLANERHAESGTGRISPGEGHGLSEKEQEIVALVAQGLNNREIAEQLFLSEGTVRNYISQILDKLTLRDRTQLACFYYKNLE